MNEVSSKSTPEHAAAVYTAVTQGNTTLSSVNAMLATGASIPSEGEGLLKKVMNELKFAQDQVASIQKLLTTKQDTTQRRLNPNLFSANIIVVQ